MPSFYTVATGNTGGAQDINQVINALSGVAGQGVPLSPTALSDSVNFALAVKNNEAVNSRALQVLKSTGLVLIQADVNGVVVSPDGVAAAAQVVNLSLAQTLTNKTLTSPTISPATPTADGVLGTTAGGILNMGNGTANQLMGAYKIAETVLGIATAAFDFQSLPQTYRHLIIEVMGRGDTAVVTTSGLIRFNNDSGANYNRHWWTATGTTAPSTIETIGATSGYIGDFSAASAVAGTCGTATLFIPNYKETTFFKTLRFMGGSVNPNGAATSVIGHGGASWANTAAITRITILPGAGNWIAGSTATVYGVP